MHPALARLLLASLIFAMTAATAVACTAKEPTSLSTSLSGGGKEGAEITVTEGTGVKDQATLSGKNAAKATGSIKYSVYSDSKCEKLVTKAGESEFTGGKVPASEEKKLEAGAVYYWRAVYSGDSIDEGSTSPCNEVLTVKAKTTLSTTLSGGGEEGGEILLTEEEEAKDQATLSGTKSSTATGTLKYNVYKDKECKELATGAGEVTVKEGKAPASSGVKLSRGTYYWLAEYEGDSLHEKSTSACGSAIEIALQQTTLCSVEPTVINGHAVCPEGDGYNGEIETDLDTEVESEVVLGFESEAGEPEGKVSCSEASLVGSFKEDGTSFALGGGVIGLFLSGPEGAPCTSTAFESPKVEIEFENLPYDESEFLYEQSGSPQGSLSIQGSGGILQATVRTLFGTLCFYSFPAPVRTNVSWTSLVLQWKAPLSFSYPPNATDCKARMRGSITFDPLRRVFAGLGIYISEGR